ncbi:MAG: hypothetical protein V2A73_22735 [Pseudomonadota bacterium]
MASPSRANESVGDVPPPGVAIAPPARHRRRLRNYLLDKSLQLRYVLMVVTVSAAIACLLGYLIWHQASYASARIVETATGPDMAWLGDGVRTAIASSLSQSDSQLVLTMLIVGLGIMAILMLYLVVLTHRVAGPLYKMGSYFDDIREGKLPKTRRLRKHDELRDFYEHFRQMTETLRSRNHEDIERIDRFLTACEAAGLPPNGELEHCLDDLRALKRQKETSLE